LRVLAGNFFLLSLDPHGTWVFAITIKKNGLFRGFLRVMAKKLLIKWPFFRFAALKTNARFALHAII